MLNRVFSGWKDAGENFTAIRAREGGFWAPKNAPFWPILSSKMRILALFWRKNPVPGLERGWNFQDRFLCPKETPRGPSNIGRGFWGINLAKSAKIAFWRRFCHLDPLTPCTPCTKSEKVKNDQKIFCLFWAKNKSGWKIFSKKWREHDFFWTTFFDFFDRFLGLFSPWARQCGGLFKVWSKHFSCRVLTRKMVHRTFKKTPASLRTRSKDVDSGSWGPRSARSGLGRKSDLGENGHFGVCWARRCGGLS